MTRNVSLIAAYEDLLGDFNENLRSISDEASAAADAIDMALAEKNPQRKAVHIRTARRHIRATLNLGKA